MFLNQVIRPDFSFIILKLFQFCNKFIQYYYNVLIKVLKYFHKIKNFGLIYCIAGSQIYYYINIVFANNKKNCYFIYKYININTKAIYI